MHKKSRGSNILPRLPIALLTGLLLTVLVCVRASADYSVFTDSFDDGDWTSNPKWTATAQSESISVSNQRSVSGSYSLKVATTSESIAIRAYSGLWSANQSYTSTFNLYIESMGDEAIPWCLQSASGGVAAVIFILPGGRVQLFVVDSPDVWSGKTANAAYSLTYGEWHSFRITYDGTTTNLYMDGHSLPDASVSQAYIRDPAKICVGNFGPAHTSTYYLDDLTIATPNQPNFGRVYVQLCSDTSTGGINTSVLHPPFDPTDWSYTSPEGQAAQVMSESFRDAHRDSLGNHVKFTWYMQAGSLYTYGANSGPLLPLELMLDYHGDSVKRWGDEIAYHYHTWIWSDPNGDGVYHWNQAPDFSYCQNDFEKTMVHMLLDRAFYPSSFRSGWHYMDNIWQNHLDEWIPYRFENAYPSYSTQTQEPIGGVSDWRRAPSEWIPYHPDANDYQTPGNLRGWDSRCTHMTAVTQADVDNVFVKALSGNSQVLTLYSHLKETDFPSQITAVHSKLMQAHNSLPQIEFEYLTGRECMLKWRNGTDVTSPTISYTVSDDNTARTVTIETDEPIYQVRPFVGKASADGTYARIEPEALGANRWRVQYDVSDTLRIAVGVTDWFGNPAVQFLPTPLRITSVSVSSASTRAEIRWETNNPADERCEYELVPDGASTSTYSAGSRITHRVALANLLPGRIYKITLASEDIFGQQAEHGPVYIITKQEDPTVIDNVDPGFATRGSWSTGNTAAGRYGADYRWCSTSPTGSDYASWTWEVQQPGTYRISAWWSSGSNRSTAAKYTIARGTKTYEKVVNQQINGGQWNTLETLELAEGDTITVRLWNTAPTGYVVIADAVKFERAYVPVSSVGLARVLPNGSEISVADAAVTAVYDGYFYVESLDRCAGIRVQGTGVSLGDVLCVLGELGTIEGERVLTCPIIRPSGMTAILRPLGTSTKDIERSTGTGITTAGLLLKTWGRVTAVDTGRFWVDDGSAAADDAGHLGLRVDCSMLAEPPKTGDFAVVTGVLGSELSEGRTTPLLRPRTSDDMLFVKL